jgi:hypothetical protein
MNANHPQWGLIVGLVLASSAVAQQAPSGRQAQGVPRADTAPGVTRAVSPGADTGADPSKVVDSTKPETARDDQKTAPETARDDPPAADTKKPGEVKQGVRSNTPP